MTVAGTNDRKSLATLAVALLIAAVFAMFIRQAVAQTTATTTTGTTTTTITTTTGGTQTTVVINQGGSSTFPVNGIIGPSVVGGVSVNVDGVLKLQDTAEREKLLAEAARHCKPSRELTNPSSFAAFRCVNSTKPFIMPLSTISR